MAELLALLVLSITSENLLKIHCRAETQNALQEAEGKGPKPACTFYQREIYCMAQKQCVTMTTTPSGPPHFYAPCDLELAELHKGIYIEIWKSLQATGQLNLHGMLMWTVGHSNKTWNSPENQ